MKKSELKSVVRKSIHEATADSPTGKLEKALSDAQTLLQKFETQLNMVDDAIGEYGAGMPLKNRKPLQDALNDMDGACEDGFDGIRKMKKLIATNQKAGM